MNAHTSELIADLRNGLALAEATIMRLNPTESSTKGTLDVIRDLLARVACEDDADYPVTADPRD